MYLRIVCVCVTAVVSALRATAAEPPDTPSQFVTSTQCIACHVGLTTPSGEDVSIGFDWRATMMANAARDPYWHAGVRREVIDHPTAQAAIEDKCSTCHMPMARIGCRRGRSAGPGVRESRRCGAAARARGRRRVLHGVPPDRGRGTRRARELRRRLQDRAARRFAGRVRSARCRCGPTIRDALRGRVHADRGHAHPAIGALRDLSHAVHDGA